MIIENYEFLGSENFILKKLFLFFFFFLSIFIYENSNWEGNY